MNPPSVRLGEGQAGQALFHVLLQVLAYLRVALLAPLLGQLAGEDQLDRIRDLGVAVSFFAPHVWYWGDRHRDIFLGPERAARLDPLASASQRGIRFGLHTTAR